jgi:hemerythrin superfamily protein
LQTVQKDAILRQWKETKREKSELQKVLDKIKPRALDLEERLRLYDIALDQVGFM